MPAKKKSTNTQQDKKKPLAKKTKPKTRKVAVAGGGQNLNKYKRA